MFHIEGGTYGEVFRTGVLRRGAQGPKRDKITEVCRKLQCQELHDLYSTKYYPGYQIKENGMGRVCGTYGIEESFVRKPINTEMSLQIL